MKYFLTIVVLCGLFILAQSASAIGTDSVYKTSVCKTGSNGQLVYCPLEPIVPGSETGNIKLPDLLNTLFKVLMSVGALFAVVSLTVAGIEVMISEIPVVKNKARERAWAAVWGLLLLAASYLILFTINPCLTSFNLLNTETGVAAKCSSPITTPAATPENTTPALSYGVCAPPTYSTNSPLSVFEGYHIGSRCGAEMQRLAQDQSYALVETANMGAVIVTKKSNASSANALGTIKLFTAECEAAEGIATPASNKNTTDGRVGLVTIFLCVQ